MEREVRHVLSVSAGCVATLHAANKEEVKLGGLRRRGIDLIRLFRTTKSTSNTSGAPLGANRAWLLVKRAIF